MSEASFPRLSRHNAKRFGATRVNIVSKCDLVEAAKNLNVLQPAALPPEGGSHTSDHDGLASLKRRSREGGHNSGTVEPDRGPRLTVSL